MSSQSGRFSQARVAVVAIGRNEGQRMVRALEAAIGQAPGAVVYVDSGSSDGSLARAQAMGASTIALDTSAPFTAARARNLGLSHVRQHLPHAQYVQFLDADCELQPGWLNVAVSKLEEDPAVAGVAGILRERYPEASIYNRLCDLEWQAPAGESRAVGGNAMFRIAALQEVGGYNPTLIAGEEPEMCVRLRERGWRLWRLAEPMALHDAAMTRLGQWWKRAVRFGFAQAQVSQLHRKSPQRIWARETRSTILWAMVPPLSTLAAAAVLVLTLRGWWWLLGLTPLLAYCLLGLKIYLSRRRLGEANGTAVLYSVAAVGAKFPQFQGVARYARFRARRSPSEIIEYK